MPTAPDLPFGAADGRVTVPPVIGACLGDVRAESPDCPVVATGAAGQRRGHPGAAAAVIVVGTAIWASAGAVGLGFVFAHYRWVAEVVRLLGAGYLAWLGFRVIIHARQPLLAAVASAGAPRLGPAWRAGLLAGLSNPKAAVFWTSLFAALLPLDVPPWVRALAIVVVVTVAAGWYSAVACMFSLARLYGSFWTVQRRVRRSPPQFVDYADYGGGADQSYGCGPAMPGPVRLRAGDLRPLRAWPGRRWLGGEHEQARMSAEQRVTMPDGCDGLIGRTVEAVAFTWEGAAVPRRCWSVAPVRRRVEALSAVGVDVAVISEAGVAHIDGQLQLRPPGPGRLLLCVNLGSELFEARPAGLRLLHRRAGGLADRSDSMRDIFSLLARRGVGPGLVLVVGTEFGSPGGVAGSDSLLLVPEAARVIAVSVGEEPGGVPAGVLHVGGSRQAFLRLLDEQLRRRRRRRVSGVDEDPAWVIRETGIDPLRRRVTESLFTLGAGGVATRGSVEEVVPGGVPVVLAAGVYDGAGPGQHLLPGPGWTGLAVDPAPAEDVRVLDLRTGVLARTEQGADAQPLRSLRLASVTIPGVVAMRAEAPAARLRRPGAPLQRPREKAMTGGRQDGRHWARVDADRGGGVGALAVQRTGLDGRVRTVERVAAYVSSQRRRPAPAEAADALGAAEDLGFDRLLAEHRAAWAARWEAVDVRIPDDPAAQLALRFALFQLWCNIKSRDELAVGARGLSGTGYAGHVFWDADVFVLPAVLSIDPAAAAAMIRYRRRRLRAAQARARAGGRLGARFPWESAASGEDVTPARGYLGGRLVPILTGQLEEHVTADVAWAAAHYAEWTARPTRLVLPLLLETAEYWASRCRRDDAGNAHIDGVIGPDEYHERVDDNAYTNVMARWNLRAAADAADRAGLTNGVSRRWRELAERIVDGYDPATGRYEQFAGYFGLEPLLVADFAAPPVAADLLLGRERVAGSQVIKQPDVLMLHHLVPGEVAAGSLAPNLDFYGPRTAYGSSLSPAVAASLLARAGRPDEALVMLRTALALDLADLSGTTAAGLHMANLGGVWQAVLAGFVGLQVRAGALSIDPQLPGAWGSLQLRFRCLGRRVRLDITRERVEIGTNGPLLTGLAGEVPRCVAGRASLGRHG